MARKIFVQASSGGTGGGLTLDLPLLGTYSLADVENSSGYSPLTSILSGITQLNANQFGYAEHGFGSPWNIGVLQSLPFQVSESGVVTTGTKGSTTRSSTTSRSTAYLTEVFPGRLLAFSTDYISSTWQSSSYGVTFSSSNTCSHSASGSNISDTYRWPNGYGPFGIGDGSYAIAPGYNNSGSYGGFTVLNYTGSSGYNYSSGTTLNSYSSTTGSTPAHTHWSDLTNRQGMVIDHRTSASGYYATVHYLSGGSATYTNVGYLSTVFGDPNAYNNIIGFKHSSGKCFYLNTSTNLGVQISSTGNVNATAIPFVLTFNQDSISQKITKAIFALGNDYFAAPDASGGNLLVFKLNNSGTSWSGTVKAVLSSFGGGLVRPMATYSGFRTAGTQNQFLIAHNGRALIVYDFSSITPLLV